MKPPDVTARAFRSFLEAPPGEPARSAFGAFTAAQAAEERRDAADPRQPGLPGMKVKAAQGILFTVPEPMDAYLGRIMRRARRGR